MEDDQNKQSQFYSEKPTFGGVPTPDKRPRLEGNKGLLVFTLIIIVLVAISAIYFFTKGA